jgi:ribose 5-phosphate isomerase A
MIEAEKLNAAIQALDLIEDGCILGVGTGSTVNKFIDNIAKAKFNISAVVASSKQTKLRLEQQGLMVVDLNCVERVDLYIDGADAIDDTGVCIKGGGGALTQEKIIASSAKHWVCIVDSQKVVDNLYRSKVALEVIPSARGYVARELVKLGLVPVYREGFITDNHNIILDIVNLTSQHSLSAWEDKINTIVGVVENGIFAKTPANKTIVGNV